MSLDPITTHLAFKRELSAEDAAREEEMMRRLENPQDLNDALLSVLVDQVVERLIASVQQNAIQAAFVEDAAPLIS